MFTYCFPTSNLGRISWRVVCSPQWPEKRNGSRPERPNCNCSFSRCCQSPRPSALTSPEWRLSSKPVQTNVPVNLTLTLAAAVQPMTDLCEIREEYQREIIIGVDFGQDLFHGVFYLRQFLPDHGTADVEHENHVGLERFQIRRREEMHKISVVDLNAHLPE